LFSSSSKLSSSNQLYINLSKITNPCYLWYWSYPYFSGKFWSITGKWKAFNEILLLIIVTVMSMHYKQRKSISTYHIGKKSYALITKEEEEKQPYSNHVQLTRKSKGITRMSCRIMQGGFVAINMICGICLNLTILTQYSNITQSCYN
jgi:hypothetical protein